VYLPVALRHVEGRGIVKKSGSTRIGTRKLIWRKRLVK
jgi:hypothetical protein